MGTDSEGQAYVLRLRMIPLKGPVTLRGWKPNMPSSPGVVAGTVGWWRWSWEEEEMDWRDFRILTLCFIGGQLSEGQMEESSLSLASS